MQIETLPIDRLIPYARNSRTHSDEQVAQVAASIREFGFTNPVLIDGDGGIIAGHGRVMAARKLAMADVPCIRLAHLSEAQKRAYVIADNKLALNAGWDAQMLALELSDLQGMGFDVELTGFGMADIDELLAEMNGDGSAQNDPDAVPEILEDTITQNGDMWICGNHRVICGDSTNERSVARLMSGEMADLVVTSPPYNVGIKYATHKDKSPREAYIGFIKAIGRAFLQHLNGGRFVAWNIGVSPATFPAHQVVALEDIGLSFYRQIVWEKSGVPYPTFQTTMRKKAARHYKPNYKHELIQLFEREANVELDQHQCPLCDGDGKVPRIDAAQRNVHETLNMLSFGEPEYGGKIVIGKGYENDVWKINQSMATVDLKTVSVRSGGLLKGGKQSHCVKEHPAAFPVELPRAVMNFLTAPGEIVLDIFGGSGSTMIACEQKDRRGRLIEFDPQYVDLIVRRWQQYTGKQAVHADTGKTFDETAAVNAKK